ncbi:DUF5694 domain-containing protein [uncultured Algibacter sp.]|uniref:DUF5694 domain-containing protein n=1 Tax=uncultured Algibacter sp. TaxID=298659 RepID=UPI00262DA2F2|nr:DUF5694 domain-containing protein [uncultured Algibacter sp.]
MLLGVYHFNNPGKDSYNTEVDDYGTTKRQKEIKEVVHLLEEFKPTKILVELSPTEQSKIDSLYNLYLTNQITLEDIQGGINEVYQIGFRLGKQLNGIDVIAVDYHGNWLAPYADFIADTLVFEDYLNHSSTYAQSMKEKNDLFLKNSIRENLIYLNEQEQILDNHNYYNNIAIKVKDTANIMFTYQESEQEINGLHYQMRSFDFDNIGVELVAEWYKRNLFIYRNILENSEENDRILLIIGSGHVFYLNQLLENNSKCKLIRPNEFMSRQD